MPKFDVTFTRQITEFVTITVAAPNAGVAAQQAQDQFDNMEVIEWESTDGGGDVEIESVELANPKQETLYAQP